MRSLIAVLLLAPAAAFAGGYLIPNENARDLALCQSNVAAQNGPEAAHANPAALAGQKGLAVSASGELLYNVTTWSDPTLGSSTLRPRSNFPPELAASYGNTLPNGMGYGFGAAVLVPAGGSLFWPQNWPGAARIQQVDQKVWETQLSAAIQPHPLLKLGASFLYYRIVESLSQRIYYAGPQSLASLGLAGGAPSFALAGEFRAPRDIPFTLAVTYSHQAPITLEGHAHFDNVPPSFASVLQDQAATAKVTVPNIVYVGAAYDVIPNLKVMGSWNLERWRVYGSDTYIGDKGLVISVPRDYHNSYLFRFGAEYTKPSFLPKLTLRAGLQRSISDQPTNTISPTLTDASSWAVSVGAGYEVISNLRADIGYQFAFFDKVTATGPDAFPGSYDTHVHLISAGLTYRFQNL
ncbi:MAG TPA: outer membrane protein transport protein [Myxococcales bacterium]|nr:outer membrane protein transport protein [Myxococcales bacterium]